MSDENGRKSTENHERLPQIIGAIRSWKDYEGGGGMKRRTARQEDTAPRLVRTRPRYQVLGGARKGSGNFGNGYEQSRNLGTMFR